MSNSTAVIGLGFGDEGKGLVTDYLSSKSRKPLVVRFSGGHQAGHTVVLGNVRHVFSNFGSGSLRGAPTYWSRFCTVEPVGMLVEHKLLYSKGFKPRIYIDGKCPITTPFDIQKNRDLALDKNHGSVGVGFGTTIEREEKHHSLLFEDLLYPNIFKAKFNSIADYYGRRVVGEMVDTFLESCNILVTSPWAKVVYGLPKFDEHDRFFFDYIFEGSQGLLLDQHHGFFPHVTRANTGTTNIFSLTKNLDRVYLVTRAYQTRHGNGPMISCAPMDCSEFRIEADANETNKTNIWQGALRRSILNFDGVIYAAMKDEFIRENRDKCVLVVTCLDHLKEFSCFGEGGMLQFKNGEQLATFLGKALGIKNVLVSKSPDSSHLLELEANETIR